MQHGDPIRIGPESADVFSVVAYREIRDSVPDMALRLSEGRNLYPPSPVVARSVSRLFDGLVRSARVTEYECAADAAERRLVARLLSCYVGWPDLTEDCVVFVSGAQEGISLVHGWAAREGLISVVPLPVYYSFEQSARRWGVHLAAHVSADGQVHGELHGNILDVRIIPNAVTGTLFPPPLLPTPASFTLVDAICQVGELNHPGALALALRDTLKGCDPDRTAIVMTASKDLSLPRLRAGLLVTRNKALLAFAKQDRFERISATNPLPNQVMAYYLGLLAVRAERLRVTATSLDVRATLQEAGLVWFSDEEVDMVLSHWEAMAARNAGNLRMLLERDLPIAVRLRPEAGYSSLVDLDPPFEEATAYLDWCHQAGIQYGLKLNPCYVLGGTPSVWEALYPSRSLLRVNLSNSSELFTLALDRFALARAGIAGARRNSRSHIREQAQEAISRHPAV